MALIALGQAETRTEDAIALFRSIEYTAIAGSRRIDAAMLAEVAWPPAARPLTYVCGPTRLVEAVASTLVGLGHEPARIKTERFGPTGS